MATTTPAQTNFNGGELSRRLHARVDLNLYDIGVAEMTGWVPLPEGGMDACPGTIRVAEAAGPCRLIPFEFNATQGYVIEMSAGRARFYTNDVRIEANGAPVEVALPYDKAAIDRLAFHPSYDVLYLFHGAHPIRQLARIDADSFVLETPVLENGPFDPRNADRGITVSASGVSGDVTLTASAGIFAAGDVGGLFQIEADDFGDIASWEPGITVTVGQLLTWTERVYRVAGGSGRTGTVAPIHAEGVEWDGIGAGEDVNKQKAGGVQLEFVCDRFGILRITGFTDDRHVAATVLRRLPFTTASSYVYQGGYYDPEGVYVPPGGAVDYVAGTWRWRFGAFSATRGFPTCGVVWNERLVLAKGSTLYAGVAGDLLNYATYNEQGDISADMAFTYTVDDPNPIVALVADKKLKTFSKRGPGELGPSNAAAGVGPGNVRHDHQNSEGAAEVRPVELDGRILYVGKSRRRVMEADYEAQRDRDGSTDLSRYARHIGKPRFVALASQKDPNRIVWALRADGSLACAAYLPAEQVLGWATRSLGSGMAARSIATISDPAGELDQLWLAVEWRGGWHVVRMDQFRQEDDDDDPAMTDLSFAYDGGAATAFGPAPWLASRMIDVMADAAAYTDIAVGADGRFTIPNAASRVRAGLRFPARVTTLPGGGGSDNGSAIGKMRRIARMVISVLNARGLRVTVQTSQPQDMEQLLGDSVTNQGFEPFTGVLIAEDTGSDDRFGQITVERVVPAGATIRAIVPSTDTKSR